MPRKAPPKKPSASEETEAQETVAYDEAGVTPVAVPTGKPDVEVVRVKKPISVEDQIQLINFTLADNTYQQPHGPGYATVRVKPFQATPPMAKSWASRVVGPPGPARGRDATELPGFYVGHRHRQWAPLVPAKRAELIDYKEPTTEKTYPANKWREKGAVSPDGAPILHTEVQAMNFLRFCPTADAITTFIEDIDPRTNVRLFAMDILALRDKQEKQRTEMDQVTRKKIIRRR
jgi:hypothetical protein